MPDSCGQYFAHLILSTLPAITDLCRTEFQCLFLLMNSAAPLDLFLLCFAGPIRLALCVQLEMLMWHELSGWNMVAQADVEGNLSF